MVDSYAEVAKVEDDFIKIKLNDHKYC